MTLRSSFISTTDKSLISIFENSDVSSANNLQIEVILFGKSFIYIRNNRGSKPKPCGTPANMFLHEDVWLFKSTL